MSDLTVLIKIGRDCLLHAPSARLPLKSRPDNTQAESLRKRFYLYEIID
jgi:hypothetical protein